MLRVLGTFGLSILTALLFGFKCFGRLSGILVNCGFASFSTTNLNTYQAKVVPRGGPRSSPSFRFHFSV